MPSACQFKSLDALRLENDHLQVTLIPAYGAKIASLVDRSADYEWLFQHPCDLVVPPYGADFSRFDSSGFDEVFPSIDACYHPLDGTPVPDHGEVWALPWQVEQDGEQLHCRVESPTLPYRLEKRLALQGSRLRIDYATHNLGEQPLAFIWTPHALLNFNRHSRLQVPAGLQEVMSVGDANSPLGAWGTRHPYPGTDLDLSRPWRAGDAHCEKYYFTESLQEGWCRLLQTDIKRQLTLAFPVQQVPWLGVWKTQGGYRGDVNIALEPCTGVYDDVYLANRIDRVSRIPARGRYDWFLELEVSDCA